MSFRQAKRQARAILHDRIAFPVWYLPTVTGQPEYRTVRLHTKYDPLGELLRGGFAERQEVQPKAVFWRSQGDVTRNGYIVTDTEGVYRLDNIMPADDATQKVELVKMPSAWVAEQGFDPDAEYAGLGEPIEPVEEA